MNLGLLSKHRNVIYGLAILWVVFFHAATNNSIDFSFGLDWLLPFDFFLRRGNVGVDMFLFLSGICLYFSFVRNPDILSFMRKRLIRIVPSTFLIFGTYWLVRFLAIDHNLTLFLSRMTLMRFWMTGETAIWFVSLIIVLYVIYPYLFCFFFGRDGKESHFGVFIFVLCFCYASAVLFCFSNQDAFDMVEAAITRVPAFIIGAWSGKFVYESRNVGKGWIAVAIAAAILFFAFMTFNRVVPALQFVSQGAFQRFYYVIGGGALCFLIALVCEQFGKRIDMRKRIVYRFLAWTGTFSLELYLSHMMLGSIMRALPFYTKGDLALYLAMVVFAFILAWAVSKITGKISVRFRESNR